MRQSSGSESQIVEFLQKAYRHATKRLGLLSNETLPISDRIQAAFSPRMWESARRAMRNRLTEGPEGAYFDLGRYKIFFDLDFPVTDRAYLIQGITQLLTESFVFPVMFSELIRPRKGGVVLDIGANIGTTALRFSEMVGNAGRVVAVEPVTHKVLRRNLEVNHARNVTVLPVAVAEQPGNVTIEISDYCLDSSIAKREYTTRSQYYSRTLAVDATTIDEIVSGLGLARVDYIKVDIEGAEELAIRGAARTIERFRPAWSISSYHIDFMNEAQHPKLVALLKGHHYAVTELSVAGTSHILASMP